MRARRRDRDPQVRISAAPREAGNGHSLPRETRADEPPVQLLTAGPRTADQNQTQRVDHVAEVGSDRDRTAVPDTVFTGLRSEAAGSFGGMVVGASVGMDSQSRRQEAPKQPRRRPPHRLAARDRSPPAGLHHRRLHRPNRNIPRDIGDSIGPNINIPQDTGDCTGRTETYHRILKTVPRPNRNISRNIGDRIGRTGTYHWPLQELHRPIARYSPIR